MISDMSADMFGPGAYASGDEMLRWLWEFPDFLTGIRHTVSSNPDNVDQSVMETFHKVMRVCNEYPQPLVWQGFYLDHVPELERLTFLASVIYGREWLTQEIINFLTLADRPAPRSMEWSYKMPKDAAISRVGNHVSSDDFAEWLYKPDQSDVDLCLAFAGDMLAGLDGVCSPVVGCYELAPGSLPPVEIFRYTSVRVAFVPGGVFLAFIAELQGVNRSGVVFWSADRPFDMQACAGLGWRAGMVLYALGACLWRDAVQVEHKMIDIQSSRKNKTRKKLDHRSHRRGLVQLPRVVYSGSWGAAAERERVLTRAHGVKGHYRLLFDARQASSGALENAERFGFPAPPGGYTFVVPHQRGQGEVEPDVLASQVVCKGLSTFAVVADLLGG